MIGRIDDCFKFSCDNLSSNFQHEEYSLLARLSWSKNVRTEQDALRKILLGAADPHYCVLLGLSTWLEYSIGVHGAGKSFVFAYKGLDEPETIKRNADSQLKGVLASGEFETVELVIGNK